MGGDTCQEHKPIGDQLHSFKRNKLRNDFRVDINFFLSVTPLDTKL